MPHNQKAALAELILSGIDYKKDGIRQAWTC